MKFKSLHNASFHPMGGGGRASQEAAAKAVCGDSTHILNSGKSQVPTSLRTNVKQSGNSCIVMLSLSQHPYAIKKWTLKQVQSDAEKNSHCEGFSPWQSWRVPRDTDFHRYDGKGYMSFRRKSESWQVPRDSDFHRYDADFTRLLHSVRNDKAAMTGRTLNEMLMTLAIIGVLSIAAMVGLQYAMAKAKANLILNDVGLAYVEVSTNESQELGVYELSFKPESGFMLQAERIKADSSTGYTDIIIVEGIDKRVCNVLKKNHRVNGLFVVKHSDAAGVYQEFDVCDSINEMAFTYGRVDNVCDVECPINTHCEGNSCVCDWGYEIGIDGKCTKIECEEGVPVSSITKEYCCSLAHGVVDGDKCVCEEGTYLKNGQCVVVSEGFCVYRYLSNDDGYSEEGSVYQAECEYSYNYTKEGETLGETYVADCEYQYVNAPEGEETGTTYEADCSYDYSQSADGTITMEKTPNGKSCAAGQYCVLKWSKTTTDCDTNLKAVGAATIQGRCASFDTTQSTCRLQNELHSPYFAASKPCEDGQYCVLKWTKTTSDCDTPLTAAGAAKIQGRCAPFDMTYNACLLENETITPQLRATKPCLNEGEYCVLKWTKTDTDCDTQLTAAGAETIQGRCATFDRTYSACLMSGEGNTPILQAKVGCEEENTYCRLQWKSEDCSDALGAKGSDFIYGACMGFLDSSSGCPVETN